MSVNPDWQVPPFSQRRGELSQALCTEKEKENRKVNVSHVELYII